MNVLVTGDRGYIGSVVVRRLLASGHAVTGLDTALYEGCDFYEGRRQAAYAWRRGDIRDVRPGDLAGVDAVVHLAALSNDPLGALDPGLTFEINHAATITVAGAARDAGVARFVFLSSCSMYGAAGDDLVDEDAPLRPLTAYAESKVRAEHDLVALADADFAPVFLRCATAYGVSPRLRADVVLNNLAGWAVTTGSIRILSDGTPWRPLVHVEDIAATIGAVLEAPRSEVAAEAFNVAPVDANHRVSELAELVRAAAGDVDVDIAASGDPDPRSYRVDFSKLARAFPALVLGWTAAAGAAQLVDAYRAAGLTREAFEGPAYTRLHRLRELLELGRLDDTLRWRDPVAVP